MSVTVTRRAGTGRGSFAQSGQRTTVIGYTVQGIEVRALASQLAAGSGEVFTAGLPTYGEIHPELPGTGLIARVLSIDEEATGEVADVDVTYATSNASGTGLLYATPDLDGGQFVLAATFETAEVSIPFCVKDTYTVSSGGSQVSKEFWRVGTQKINEPRVVLQARWQLQGGPLTLPSVWAFEGQHGKIHQLGSRRYVFTAGSITPRDNNTFEVTASWTGDNGTALQSAGANVDSYRLPPDMGYLVGTSPNDLWPNDGSLMRSPFHVLETRPSPLPDDPNVSPVCYQVAKFAEDLNGYQSLPGVPFS
jgi:hypothetical protein